LNYEEKGGRFPSGEERTWEGREGDLFGRKQNPSLPEGGKSAAKCLKKRKEGHLFG